MKNLYTDKGNFSKKAYKEYFYAQKQSFGHNFFIKHIVVGSDTAGGTN